MSQSQSKRDFLQQFFNKYERDSETYFLTMRLRNNPFVKGTIVDIETTGLDPEENQIVTLGTYSGYDIEIRQLYLPNYLPFRYISKRTVEKKSKPLYAYFAHFEKDFLDIPQGWICLGRYGPGRCDLDYEIRLRLVDVTVNPCEYGEDDIDGAKVPQLWQRWLNQLDGKILAEIAYHCYIDLLRERQLL